MTVHRLAVVGASGRMGRAVVRLAAEAGNFEVVCAVAEHEVGRDAGELAGIARLGVPIGSDVQALTSCKADVVVDFSTPSTTHAVASLAAAASVALVSGTTGLDETTHQALKEASLKIPVLWESNMSRGVHVLAELVKQAVALLGEEFDIEIVEAHHGQKVDAPSGTALKLAAAVQEARKGLRLVHGRQGRPGARSAAELGMHAVRGGDVFGEHTVYFFGEGERLELTHRASNRDVWAAGALAAARWLVGQKPGLYRLGDIAK